MKLFQARSNRKILKKLSSKFPKIKEAIIVSDEGMPLNSTLSQEIEHVKIAGITLAILSAAKRLISETKNGNFKQLSIKSSEGYLIGYWLSSKKLLFIVSPEELALDSIF
ncbi:MAG: roadblock/LC7 domain-containing protein [Candidatus Hodarchaeota archaeon]